MRCTDSYLLFTPTSCTLNRCGYRLGGGEGEKLGIPTAAALREWCRAAQMAVEVRTGVGIFLIDQGNLALVELGMPRRANERELQMYLDDLDPDLEVAVTHDRTGAPSDCTLAELTERIAADNVSAEAEPAPEPVLSEDPDHEFELHL